MMVKLSFLSEFSLQWSFSVSPCFDLSHTHFYTIIKQTQKGKEDKSVMSVSLRRVGYTELLSMQGLHAKLEDEGGCHSQLSHSIKCSNI